MAENTGISEEFGKQLGEALRGPQLSKKEKYIAFLDGQEWFNSPSQPINVEAPPAYYVDMTKHERSIHNITIEFTNAANFKKARTVPPNLEALSKYEGWGGLQTPEVKKLYEVPGVKKALERYIQIYEADEPMGKRKNQKTREDEDYSLRTAGNRTEVFECRKTVRKELKEEVVNGYKKLGSSMDDDSRKGLSKRGLLTIMEDKNKELLDLKCREAEQIAFTLLYLGNTFESLDSKYSNMGRVRSSNCMNDLVNIPIKFAMNPLDTLLGTLNKGGSGVIFYGRLGEWAYNQALASNGGNALSIESVQFIADENNPRSKNDFWRVSSLGKNDKKEETHRIIIPECYPRDLVKSIWEEAEANVDKKKVKLIDFLRKGEEIPWDRVSDSMYIDYALKLGKAGVISDILQGKIPIKWGDNDTVGEWIQNAQNALARFGLRNADSVKRWMLYASVGINFKTREPKLRDQNRKLQIKGQMGQFTGNYLPHNKLFFPWDQMGLFI